MKSISPRLLLLGFAFACGDAPVLPPVDAGASPDTGAEQDAGEPDVSTPSGEALLLSQARLRTATGFVACVEVSILDADGATSPVEEGLTWALSNDGVAEALVLDEAQCFVGLREGTSVARASLGALESAPLPIDVEAHALRFQHAQSAVENGLTLIAGHTSRHTLSVQVTSPSSARIPGDFRWDFVRYSFDPAIAEIDPDRQRSLRGVSVGSSTMRATYEIPGGVSIAFEGSVDVRIIDAQPESLSMHVPNVLERGDCIDVDVAASDSAYNAWWLNEAEVDSSGRREDAVSPALARFCFDETGSHFIEAQAHGLSVRRSLQVVVADMPGELSVEPREFRFSIPEAGNIPCTAFTATYAQGGERRDVSNEVSLSFAASDLSVVNADIAGDHCFTLSHFDGARVFDGTMSFGFADASVDVPVSVVPEG